MQVSWDHLGLKALKAGGHEKVIPCRLPCRHADVSNWQILSVCKRLQLSILAWSSGHFELRSMRWLPLCGEAINFLASCYCLANILLVRSTPSLGFEVTPRDHDFAELSNIVSEIVPRSFIFLRFFSDLKSGPFRKFLGHLFLLFLRRFWMFLCEEPSTFPCSGNFSTSIGEVMFEFSKSLPAPLHLTLRHRVAYSSWAKGKGGTHWDWLKSYKHWEMFLIDVPM